MKGLLGRIVGTKSDSKPSTTPGLYREWVEAFDRLADGRSVEASSLQPLPEDASSAELERLAQHCFDAVDARMGRIGARFESSSRCFSHWRDLERALVAMRTELREVDCFLKTAPLPEVLQEHLIPEFDRTVTDLQQQIDADAADLARRLGDPSIRIATRTRIVVHTLTPEEPELSNKPMGSNEGPPLSAPPTGRVLRLDSRDD